MGERSRIKAGTAPVPAVRKPLPGATITDPGPVLPPLTSSGANTGCPRGSVPAASGVRGGAQGDEADMWGHGRVLLLRHTTDAPRAGGQPSPDSQHTKRSGRWRTARTPSLTRALVKTAISPKPYGAHGRRRYGPVPRRSRACSNSTRTRSTSVCSMASHNETVSRPACMASRSALK